MNQEVEKKQSSAPAAEKGRQLEYHVGGMTCAACSAAVERAVRRVEGVQSASVNLILEKLTVEAPQDFDEDLVVRAVERPVIRPRRFPREACCASGSAG